MKRDQGGQDMAVLEINNIRKSFRGREVLKDISISVEEGEVIAILGPSGSGKSTLLRCATMLETMDDGSLAYEGAYACTSQDGHAVYAGKNELREIKKSFANLLYAQENVAFTQKLYEQVKNWRYSSGPWTRIRQKAIVAQIKARYQEAQSELNRAKLAMLVSLNKELNSPLTVSGSLEPVSTQGDLPHFQLWATEFRPELKSAIYALELDNIAIDLALSKRYPDILLNASYERVGDSDLDDENKQVSLAVRLPIPYTFSQQVNQKKAEQRKSTLHRSAIEDKIHVQVATSFEQMIFWQQEVLDRQAIYQELTSLLDRNAKNAPLDDLVSLEARREYLQMGQSYLEALRENHIAKAQLEWAIGKDL